MPLVKCACGSQLNAPDAGSYQCPRCKESFQSLPAVTGTPSHLQRSASHSLTWLSALYLAASAAIAMASASTLVVAVLTGKWHLLVLTALFAAIAASIFLNSRCPSCKLAFAVAKQDRQIIETKVEQGSKTTSSGWSSYFGYKGFGIASSSGSSETIPVYYISEKWRTTMECRRCKHRWCRDHVSRRKHVGPMGL